jgi:hypothetical protein
MSETQTEPKSTKPRIYKNVKWALICGTLGLLLTVNQLFCIGGLLTLFGLILGILSLLKIRKSNGMLTGRWMALLSLLLFVIYTVLMSVNIITFNRSIHCAAMRGNIEDIKVMLTKNPELINKKNKSGDTPLHYAALGGYKEVVELLCACGADVTAQDKFGHTPLHCAARGGHKEVVEFLCACGAYVTAQDKFGHTPLHCAARRGHKEVVEFLCACGADVNTRNKFGKTPLYYATENDHKEVMDFLQKFDGVKNEQVR